jgi:hypothetical protein
MSGRHESPDKPDSITGGSRCEFSFRSFWLDWRWLKCRTPTSFFDVQSKKPKDDAEWKTVENAAVAIAETANLITLPGRLREDGKPVPSGRADWNKFAEGLVTAGNACLKAAKMKSPEGLHRHACGFLLQLPRHLSRRAPARGSRRA